MMPRGVGSIERVITGGQSGSDQAAWRAARKCGIPTGGWMPRGWLTEDGPRPEFATRYGAWEHESPEYPDRTRANVAEADVLLWFGDPSSAGGRLTLQAWHSRPRPAAIVTRPRGLWDGSAELIRLASGHLGRPVVLLVAGNRESVSPGVGAWVEAYCRQMFRALGYRERWGS